MATERLPMRHIREILRLKWGLKRSHRETARSLGISPGAVASVLTRAMTLGLTWDALAALTDDALEQRLYGPKLSGGVARPLPDPTWLHTELRRAGVTLEVTMAHRPRNRTPNETRCRTVIASSQVRAHCSDSTMRQSALVRG